jgi:hypothetical protein
MPTFTPAKRLLFIQYFLLLFYTLAFYRWLNGMLLYQMQPQIFNTRYDITTWIFMLPGIHRWALGNPVAWTIFDIFFYCIPIIWFAIWRKNERAGQLAGIAMLVINWMYVQYYCLYPTSSIEMHLSWLLLPILFSTRKLKSFYFILHGLRYFFLFFFASAAIWKFRQGGFFNLEQMSGVLLLQHKEFLVTAPNNWYTHFIYWLIQHQTLGYLLYAAATLLELIFVVGFFTKKFDKWLFAGFILFLIMDMLVMRIPYFDLLPLAFTLLFSGYKEPVSETE